MPYFWCVFDCCHIFELASRFLGNSLYPFDMKLKSVYTNIHQRKLYIGYTA